ncbi:hypothetical protein BCR32DRAFT_324711 [Anaeromyces robustus]|jgi:hypothetical protein|uniref:CBM10 domain-containing protein n=1 Tax=Anaeromyces robustus TaxID=1754192 RepID=A0A1Y1XMN1_9FUNG|nr:hypothetical protein BCR32DRAFT_324711 [Anaeromyces robustus]|eukprot:ORX87009.1 hypothetical protein BCR32DRAFT_324711 [Anaeromyces robustus]
MRFAVFASILAAGAFASKCNPDYPCCNNCEVIYVDSDGEWGVENNNWCAIDASQCYEGDYPFCKGCTVVYTDNDGDWGVENNDWCLIKKSNCDGGKDKTNEPVISGKQVLPIISLYSESGTNDFATKPVEKHIAQQAYMGRNKDMPPEPWYEQCTITIQDTDGSKPINNVGGRVKVRGNWTSNYVKKSLRINFDQNQTVLGLNNGNKIKSWVLLAEYKDGSMLRNKSAFAMSRDILGEDNLFASDSKLAELYINGEYFGVYLIAEVQQVNQYRVNITKPEDGYQGTDIGYFMEYDIGYTRYEDKIQTFTVNFNDNAPLKPYDGNGGSGKTVSPSGSFSFGGGGMGQFPGMGGQGGQFPGMGGQGGQYPGMGGQGGQGGRPGQTGGQAGQGGQYPGMGGQGGAQFPGMGGQGGQGGQGGMWNFGGNAGGNTGDYAIPYTADNNELKKRQFAGMGGGDNMTIKNDVTQEQNDFISNFVNGAYKIMYEAAYNQNTLKFTSDYRSIVEAPELTPRQAIENVLDANSLADMFIISEMTCDADLYYSSFYVVADFGPKGSKKLRFEAPWDFDSALGNRDRCRDGQGHFAANIVLDTSGFGDRINPWLAVIIYEDWYQDIIRTKWTKAYNSGVFGKVVDMIHQDTKTAAEAFDRNYSVWDNIRNNSNFVNELSPGAKQCKTQQEAADYLAYWIEERTAFVNKNWHK